MKRGAVITTALTILLSSTSAFAFGDSSTCNVPDALKEGKAYVLIAGNTSLKSAEIVKIDKKTCWAQIKTPRDGLSWLNLNTVELFQETGK